MRIAHVREVHAPAGSPFRLAAALPDGRLLDLEVARRRVAREEPRLAHNDPLFRVPLTTLDALLASGARVEALRAVVEPFLDRPELLPAIDDEDDELTLDAGDLRFGPPILRPASLRDFYAFEGHVATMWGAAAPRFRRRGIDCRSSTSRTFPRSAAPARASGSRAGRRSSTTSWRSRRSIDTPARDLPAERAEEAIGGYTIFNDWSARDLQRDETTVRLGPAKGKDFASSIGPWLVTPDELADARSGKGFDLAATASVNGKELSRGTWSDIHFSFGEMLARASSDARLVPGDLIGSGTVGTGCLLEIRESSGFGRYLEPGDTVTLAVERLGELTTPIVERPGEPGGVTTDPVDGRWTDWPAVRVRSIYEDGIATRNATFETTAPTWADWHEARRQDCRLVARVEGVVVGWAALTPYSTRHAYRGVAEVSVYVAARGGWPPAPALSAGRR